MIQLPIEYAFVGFAIGLFLFFQGLREFKLKKIAESIPTSKIRSIAVGLVEIYGKIVPSRETLKAPLSGKDCVYYDYKIERKIGRGKYRRWITLARGKKHVHFYINDGTAQVLIDPQGARIDVPHSVYISTGALGVRGRIFGEPVKTNKLPESVKRYLIDHGITYEEGLLGFQTLSIKEKILSVGDDVYILGWAGDNPFVGETWARSSWEDLMIQKGKYEKIYYISNKSPKELLKLLRRRIIFYISVGLTLTMGCLFYIFYHLKLI